MRRVRGIPENQGDSEEEANRKAAMNNTIFGINQKGGIVPQSGPFVEDSVHESSVLLMGEAAIERALWAIRPEARESGRRALLNLEVLKRKEIDVLILAERERCAIVAESCSGGETGTSRPGDSEFVNGYYEARRHIAAKIRRGE